MGTVLGPASYRNAGWRRWLAVLVVGVVIACHTVPVTGRKTVNFFSAEDDVRIGNEAWEQVLAESRVVKSGPQAEMVARAMTRLAAVADDPGFEWEVALLDEPDTINAFALPGGKMAVYTGILPVTNDENGLAVVMGHEIGHVVAQHGTERMTSTYGLDTVLSLLDIGDYGQLAQLAINAFVTLPFGRKQESEADRIGLIYMARAGYDPREAIAFWQRMEGASGGGGPPEFLSTHPSHETRIEDLKEAMPEALELWRAAGGGGSF